jgi:TonB family protein
MQRTDILEQPEHLWKPFWGSLVFHAGMTGLALLFSVVSLHKSADWGSLNPGGGAIGINPVKGVPLPARPGIINPLANDSQTTVPLPPPKAKPQPKAKAPEPEAIPLKSRKVPKKASEAASPRTTYRPPGYDRPNQLTSTTGPALVSPLINQAGGGGVGIGQGSTLGTRFGWYADLLIQRITEHWRPDTQAQSSAVAVITFVLQKDGSVRDVRIAQRSGNNMLDFSAQRAVYDSVPFQPIPPGAGDSARIELNFRLRQ